MKDLLGTRMKEQYENRARIKLMRRCPTIIRIDGKAFHTYTKGLNKPFDEGLIDDMVKTTKYLCKEVQGCKLGYVQSDEISLLLTDYDTIETQAWFDYNLQKMASISASLATAYFNRLRIPLSDKQIDTMKLANFDSRVFQIADHDEVVNYFIWRFFDCTRNSISGFAQSLFSPKELNGKNTDKQVQMCKEKGHDWEQLPLQQKYGTLVYYEDSVWRDGYFSKSTVLKERILPLLQRKD